MKFALMNVILLAAAGACSAQTQADCEFHCVACSVDDKACETIYQACMEKCKTGAAHGVAPVGPNIWGAIAISPSTLLEGHSWNSKTEQDAARRALKECQAAAKAGDCKVVIKVDDVCASLAVSKPEKVYAVGGPTGAVSSANRNAMLRCQREGGKSCEVLTAFCADGVSHEATRAPEPPGRQK